jgi:hypothetical protein
MIDTKTVQALKIQLFGGHGSLVFALLDGASMSGITQSLAKHNPEHFCLYRGELAADMAEAAPYLVRLEWESAFTDWLFGSGWGRHWGVFGVAVTDMRALRNHLRKLLNVYDSDGTPLYFRYYDPRVLPVYLPTCNSGELAAFFGPIHSFLMEDASGAAALRFTLSNSGMIQETVNLSGVGR